MNYIEETLKFIESEEMREYLREYFQSLPEKTARGWTGRYVCSEIVTFAPVSLEKKIPVLDLIAEQTEADPDNDYQDPAKFAQEMRIALDERYNNPPGTMFWLRDWHYHEEGCCYDDAFFTEFDAAVRYIKQQNEQNAEYLEDPETYYSHSIDKYIPGEDGVLEEYCQWVLNWSGEIWYFDYGDNKFEPDGWNDIMDYLGAHVNLPVPFEPGDIITADCRPFSRERRVLVMDIGDNSDCCAVQCLYLKPNGKMSVNAFKHNSFHSFEENSHISGLYRAARYHGELPEDEAVLGVITAAIKADSSLGIKMRDYIWYNEVYDKDDDNDCPGAVWEQFKEAFGL